MTKHFEIDDRAFHAGLERALSRHARTAEVVVGEVGREVADATRRAAPKRTGRLRRGISSHTGRDRRGPFAQVDVEPFYASFIEFDPGRAFFRPALEQARRLLHERARRFT